MKDMKDAIEEYKKIIATNGTDFSTSDIEQIYEMGNDPWALITNALKAGYTIGYRACEHDSTPRPGTK